MSRTVLDLFNQTEGLKIDFGGGDYPLHPTCIPFDVRYGKRAKQGLVRVKGDISDRNDPELLRLGGKVSFAICRHTLCCIPRDKALQTLMNIRFSLVESGIFLLVDFDFSKLFEVLRRREAGETLESAISSSLGKTFYDWFLGIYSDYSVGSFEPSLSDFFNIAMRGLGGTEIQFRYSQEDLSRLLEQAGFSRILAIPRGSELASIDFTHTRNTEDQLSGEDLAFLCIK